MFLRLQTPNTSYNKLTEGIRKELMDSLLQKGVMVKSLEIVVRRGNINLSLYINEKSAR